MLRYEIALLRRAGGALYSCMRSASRSDRSNCVTSGDEVGDVPGTLRADPSGSAGTYAT
jgi:hypothetical protein